jgi:hypothetical protein
MFVARCRAGFGGARWVRIVQNVPFGRNTGVPFAVRNFVRKFKGTGRANLLLLNSQLRRFPPLFACGLYGVANALIGNIRDELGGRLEPAVTKERRPILARAKIDTQGTRRPVSLE